jgi:hypothetical protein
VDEQADPLAGLRLRPLAPRGQQGDGLQEESWLPGSGAGHDLGTNSSSSAVSSSGSSQGSGNCRGSDESDDGDGDEHCQAPDEIQLHGGDAGSEASGAGGWAVTLDGLQLDNVDYLEVVQAVLQLTCSRCGERYSLALTAEGSTRMPAAASSGSSPAAAAGAPPPTAAAPLGTSSSSKPRPFEFSGSCSTCQAELAVLLRPRFVHTSSNVLAGLKAVGCTPLDLLPSLYGASCAECDAVCAMRCLQVRHFQRAAPCVLSRVV